MRFRNKDEINKKGKNPYMLTQEEVDELLNNMGLNSVSAASGLSINDLDDLDDILDWF